jgi:hypothetical protein
MTLPNKMLFWAIAGFALGQDLRTRNFSTGRALLFPTRALSIVLAIAILLPTAAFGQSFVALNGALSKMQKGQPSDYEASRFLPCVIYINAQMRAVVASEGNQIQGAKQILDAHPRCLDALGYLANEAISRNDYAAAKPYVYSLLDVAPARQSVVGIAAVYAVEAKDIELQALLSSQGIKLGLIPESK